MSSSRRGKLGIFGGSSKKKSFSSKGKIEKYNQDGTESIIVMGRPFRVVQKISEYVDQVSILKRGSCKSRRGPRSYVFIVENTENLPEFPHRFALKRSFFNVDELMLAHTEPDVFGRVKDKNIVHVFHSEVTRSDGRIGVTIAMVYYSSNLYNRIQQGMRFTEGEIVQVLLAITSSVGYLHSQQPPIAHRNICPESILIDPNFPDAMAYRLCGFGGSSTEAFECTSREEVAVALEDIERHTEVGFRAPEMADPGSGKRIDERVDLWSIGVLLYYMMYLQLPFGETVLGLTGQFKLRFPAGSESLYTSSFSVALTHLLEPDPEKRWDIFALTNFLRFDENISKHIGTFFFTATERPDGWERQAVRVLNRSAVTRQSHIRLNANERVMSANGDEARRSVTSTDTNVTRLTPEELDPETLAALGITPADIQDPGMKAYYEMLIREQEEVMQSAKVAAKIAKQGEDKSTAMGSEETKETKGDKEQPVNDAAAEPCKKHDIFADLFDTTPLPQHPLDVFASPPPAVTQPVEPTNAMSGGNSWDASLFGGAAPVQQQQTQAQVQQSYDAIMMDGGWQSGAPTTLPAMVTGGGNAGSTFQWPQATVSPQFSIPPHVQQQTSSLWGAGATPLSQTMSLQPPQEQQQQQQSTQNAVQGNLLSSASTHPKKEEKKDPFEELFNNGKQL